VAVVARPSKARIWWFVVLIVVLLALLGETRSTKTAKLNLLINGNTESAGATVYINGSAKGTLQILADADLGGTGFWTDLPDGKYSIEIRKPGFNDFKTNIDLNTLAFVAVDLTRSGKASEAPPQSN
jgi:hypothetical protein